MKFSCIIVFASIIFTIHSYGCGDGGCTQFKVLHYCEYRQNDYGPEIQNQIDREAVELLNANDDKGWREIKFETAEGQKEWLRNLYEQRIPLVIKDCNLKIKKILKIKTDVKAEPFFSRKNTDVLRVYEDLAKIITKEAECSDEICVEANKLITIATNYYSEHSKAVKCSSVSQDDFNEIKKILEDKSGIEKLNNKISEKKISASNINQASSGTFFNCFSQGVLAFLSDRLKSGPEE